MSDDERYLIEQAILFLRTPHPASAYAVKILLDRFTDALAAKEKAEGEAAARLECMKAAVQPWNRGNCPGHSHRELERWDNTNKPCSECIAWNAALSATAGRELADELRELREFKATHD